MGGFTPSHSEAGRETTMNIHATGIQKALETRLFPPSRKKMPMMPTVKMALAMSGGIQFVVGTSISRIPIGLLVDEKPVQQLKRQQFVDFNSMVAATTQMAPHYGFHTLSTQIGTG